MYVRMCVHKSLRCSTYALLQQQQEEEGAAATSSSQSSSSSSSSNNHGRNSGGGGVEEKKENDAQSTAPVVETEEVDMEIEVEGVSLEALRDMLGKAATSGK